MLWSLRQPTIFYFQNSTLQLDTFVAIQKQEMRQITPANLEIVQLRYLDSAGTVLSLGNKLLLKSTNPKPASNPLLGQIHSSHKSNGGYVVGLLLFGVRR